jgi:hypothetical protein
LSALPNELRDLSALAVLTLRGGARIFGFSRLRVKSVVVVVVVVAGAVAVAVTGGGE